jgi:uncharacterized protein YutE (UPF0331/DUF86 family)
MINDKLKRLEENLRILSKIKEGYSIDDIIADKVDEWGLRYGLFESIQIVIDIACSVVAEKNLGVPKNYSECITILITNKYLDKQLGEKIIRMVGLRNLLVHEYGVIDIRKLYEYLSHIQDLKDFAYAVSKL